MERAASTDGRDPTGPSRRSEPRSASGGNTRAPDEQVAGFIGGNDPTDGWRWVRRLVHLEGAPGDAAFEEALSVVLDLPGVARARRTGGGITIDMRPDVLSDQELEGALERAALGVDGWTDEALAPQPPSEEAT